MKTETLEEEVILTAQPLLWISKTHCALTPEVVLRGKALTGAASLFMKEVR